MSLFKPFRHAMAKEKMAIANNVSGVAVSAGIKRTKLSAHDKSM
jgi:hypothetical protein